MNNLKENIVGITLGIRFSRSFRIPDIGGDIVDHILYNKDTPFGINFFPKVNKDTSNNERVLFNQETDEYLRITTDDIILGINVTSDFEEKYNWVKGEVLSFFKNDLFQKFKIKNVRRIGIIYSHKISEKSKLHEMVAQLTENKVTDAEAINISFSKKLAVDEAVVRKSINDYKNTIYNIQEFDGGVSADLDFQHYFEPLVEDLRECSIEEIMNDSRSFLEKDFYSWLTTYEKKSGK